MEFVEIKCFKVKSLIKHAIEYTVLFSSILLDFMKCCQKF